MLFHHYYAYTIGGNTLELTSNQWIDNTGTNANINVLIDNVKNLTAQFNYSSSTNMQSYNVYMRIGDAFWASNHIVGGVYGTALVNGQKNTGFNYGSTKIPASRTVFCDRAYYFSDNVTASNYLVNNGNNTIAFYFDGKYFVQVNAQGTNNTQNVSLSGTSFSPATLSINDLSLLVPQ